MAQLWHLDRPLILASKSQARRALLAAAGIPFEAIDAGIDERAVERPLLRNGAGGSAVAAALARAKALAVSARHPDRLVVGADQTLSVETRLLSKPADLESARRQLMSLAGRTHTLHAALCLARGGATVADASAHAYVTCREFTSDFVESYLALAGDGVLQNVGGYAVEGLGIHLFDRIDGEHSTILGLPMLPLLALLRDHGAVER